MKTLIIYTSQTGFTKKYAQWIADEMGADIFDLKDARKKEKDFFDGYEAIAYGGWAMAGNAVGVKWFLDKSADWHDKHLAIVCVGPRSFDQPLICNPTPFALYY